MNEIILILLPLAAYSGWRLAKREQNVTDNLTRSDEYFRGLDYLLNDDTENATAVFTKLTSINKDAKNVRDIRHCITLGRLLRKRGEVDRALHLHQSLLKGVKKSGENIPNDLLSSIHLSIADDFYDAGVMNRAIEHYHHALETGTLDTTKIAVSKAITLYVRQKKWQDAINVSEQSSHDLNTLQKKIIAHCYCELAIHESGISEKIMLLHQAQKIDAEGVRANVALAEIALSQSQFITAIGHYKAINSPQALISDLDNIKLAFLNLKQPEELKDYFHKLFLSHPHPNIASHILSILPEDERADFLQTTLDHHPSFKLVIEYLSNVKHPALNYIKALDKTNESLPFSCTDCGFRTAKRHWQCPSCDARESLAID